jgi:hypothetical protein
MILSEIIDTSVEQFIIDSARTVWKNKSAENIKFQNYAVLIMPHFQVFPIINALLNKTDTFRLELGYSFREFENTSTTKYVDSIVVKKYKDHKEPLSVYFVKAKKKFRISQGSFLNEIRDAIDVEVGAYNPLPHDTKRSTEIKVVTVLAESKLRIFDWTSYG